MEAEDVLVLSRKYTERLIQGAGDPAVVQNVTKIANISTNGTIHNITPIPTTGRRVVMPATGWLNILGAPSSYISVRNETSGEYQNISNQAREALTTITMAVTKGDSLYFDEVTGGIREIKVLEVPPVDGTQYIKAKDVLFEGVINSTGNKVMNGNADDYDDIMINVVGEFNNDRYVNDTFFGKSFSYSRGDDNYLNGVLHGSSIEVIEFANQISSVTMFLEVYGIKYARVDEYVQPMIYKDEEILYTGVITSTGNIKVKDMSEFEEVIIKVAFEFPNTNSFIGAQTLVEGNDNNRFSYQKGSVSALLTIGKVDNTTLNAIEYSMAGTSSSGLYVEVSGKKKVKFDDFVEHVVYKGEETILEYLVTGLNSSIETKSMAEYDKIFAYVTVLANNDREVYCEDLEFFKDKPTKSIITFTSSRCMFDIVYKDDTHIAIEDYHANISGIKGYRLIMKGIKFSKQEDFLKTVAFKERKVLLFHPEDLSLNETLVLDDSLRNFDKVIVEMTYSSGGEIVGSLCSNELPPGESVYLSWTNDYHIKLKRINDETLQVEVLSLNVHFGLRITGYKFAPQEVNINLGLKAKDVLYYGALSKTINLNAKLSDYDEVIAESIYTNDAGDTGTLCSTIVQTGDRIINYLDAIQGSSHNIRFTATDDGVITLTSVPSGNRKLRFTGYKFIEPYTALVEDKTEIAKIPAAEIVENKTFTIPNPVAYYDEIIAQLVIPTPNGKYVVETVPYFPEGLSEGLLVISKSYTYGNQDCRRVDIRFTGAEIELFNINIAPDRDDCDLILYGVKHTSVDDITTKLVIDKSVDTLLERTEISGVMEYELQKTVEPYGMIIAALYGEWASSGLAKVSEISLDAGVPSALIYNYDSDNRAFVNVKVEGSKATVSSFLKGSGIDRLYLKITNHKF